MCIPSLTIDSQNRRKLRRDLLIAVKKSRNNEGIVAKKLIYIPTFGLISPLSFHYNVWCDVRKYILGPKENVQRRNWKVRRRQASWKN